MSERITPVDAWNVIRDYLIENTVPEDQRIIEAFDILDCFFVGGNEETGVVTAEMETYQSLMKPKDAVPGCPNCGNPSAIFACTKCGWIKSFQDGEKQSAAPVRKTHENCAYFGEPRDPQVCHPDPHDEDAPCGNWKLKDAASKLDSICPDCGHAMSHHKIQLGCIVKLDDGKLCGCVKHNVAREPDDIADTPTKLFARVGYKPKKLQKNSRLSSVE